MAGKSKVLYVSSELKPYLPETKISNLCRMLPQLVQETGKDIRTFMPKFGCINERRNQLHEVIRLSGMNIVINDTDHQLIIKVASIPSARVQVYFIDNDDYFQRKAVLCDEEGNLFEDNDERAIFFSRGVVETVSKLLWLPDVIHCHGWFSAFMPVYIKRLYKDDPLFANSKVVISLYNDDFSGTLSTKTAQNIVNEGVDSAEADILTNPTYENLMKFALQYADGVVVVGDDVNPDIVKYAVDRGVKVLESSYDASDIENYSKFYDEIIAG